ncbi:MAG: hypothetical protein ACFFAE_12965 [Candidatus Hodarchaeota archaeon]
MKKTWAQRTWLTSYFSQRLKREIGHQILDNIEPPVDFIISIANHFEPGVSTIGVKGAVEVIKEWCKYLEAIPTRDSDGCPFKHTYYFPAEQYAAELLAPLEEHCRKGFGEVEVHLHHGVDKPDDAHNLRRKLEEFKDKLRSHGFLSYDKNDPLMGPRYCFVHGNWALANSARGRFCGVDNEMEILAQTGCYMDCTLPSAPDVTQVNKINSIYECGLPLSQAIPHRVGRDLAVGDKEPIFPFLLEGPLLINWKHTNKGMYFPSIENGAIHDYNLPTIERFRLWAGAHIHVKGCPNWIFIKLHTHSLRSDHANSIRGPVMKVFLYDLDKLFNDGIKYRLHFTTSRETANIILAAVNKKTGNPGSYRDYKFKLFES